MTVRGRTELVWYDKKGQNSENGFLVLADIIYKSVKKPYSGSVRLQYFETGGYNSRIYAYENDVLYSYSVPSFFDKGLRYYLNLNYELPRKVSVWMRLAQTAYRGKKSIGTGPEAINGKNKTEIKLQARWVF